MRLRFCLVSVALVAAGCDRASPAPEQANAAAATPDEVVGGATSDTPVKTIDRSHRGEAAPAHAFTAKDGKAATVASFRGRPVLVNLWATWCGPCVRELPTLDALAAKGGVEVVALSQDSDAAKARSYFDGRGFRALKGYTDADMKWLGTVATNLPTTILYDREGREVWRLLGDLDWTGPMATEALAEGR